MLGRLYFFRYSSNFIVTHAKRSYAPRRRHTKYTTFIPNAGINQQLKSLDDVSKLIEEDPEGFGDIEADFMKISESHKQYERELSHHKHQIKLWKVTNKYFKVKSPNFLTYAEKQQIKLLHSRDPDEWTPEKLSDSFPADPDTISKVINAKWVARSKQRILLHDQAVMNNWNLYKEGKLPANSLSETLKSHIDKFANRKIEDVTKNLNYKWEPKSQTTPSTRTNEFSTIITSCKKYRHQSAVTSNNVMITTEEELRQKQKQNSDRHNFEESLSKNMMPLSSFYPGENETYLTDNIVDKRYMRLKDVKKMNNLQMTNNDEKEIFSTKEGEQQNNDIVQKLENDTKDQIKNPFDNVQKYEIHEVEISKNDIAKYDMMPSVKQRIHIPKKLWKKGATYKVDDCYYDFDGEFLYRVPGLTKQ